MLPVSCHPYVHLAFKAVATILVVIALRAISGYFDVPVKSGVGFFFFFVLFVYFYVFYFFAFWVRQRARWLRVACFFAALILLEVALYSAYAALSYFAPYWSQGFSKLYLDYGVTSFVSAILMVSVGARFLRCM